MLKVMNKIKYVFLLVFYSKNIFGMNNNNDNRYSLYNIIRDNIEFENYLELVVDERNNVVLNNNRNNMLDFFRNFNINPETARIYIRTAFGCVLYFLLMYNFYKLMFKNSVIEDKNINYH